MSDVLYPDAVSLEAALLELLKGDERLLTWRAEIKAVPGFNQQREVQLFNSLPGVGTYCPAGRYPDQGPGPLVAEDEDISLFIFCAGGNLRSAAASRTGDDTKPGAGHLVERCRLLVRGWRPGGNVKSVQPKSWRLLWADNKTAVIALEIAAVLTRPVVPTEEEIEAYGSSYPG